HQGGARGRDTRPKGGVDAHGGTPGISLETKPVALTGFGPVLKSRAPASRGFFDSRSGIRRRPVFGHRHVGAPSYRAYVARLFPDPTCSASPKSSSAPRTTARSGSSRAASPRSTP